MTVITAFELENFVASGIAARQTNRAHRGLGSGTNESYFFDGRHEFAHEFGDLHFKARGCAERESALRRHLDRRNHGRRRVPEDHRPPGADIVDVLLAILVVKIRTFTAREEYRVAAHALEGTHGRVDATGNAATRALEQCL